MHGEYLLTCAARFTCTCVASALARIPSAANEPYLTPQFGASFTIKSPMMAFLVALTGLTFNTLSGYKWGRSILLKNPKLFTIGAFTDEGPTEEMLSATSWRSVFFASPLRMLPGLEKYGFPPTDRWLRARILLASRSCDGGDPPRVCAPQKAARLGT